MSAGSRIVLLRLSPVLFIALAAGFWFYDVQGGGPYVSRNLAPLAVLVTLAWLTLHRGRGTWAGAGMRLPLATVGYAIPALGLSIYLHYAYSVNLNGMFDDALFPERLFTYLPIYTFGAGAIGSAIGWIVGRNL